MNTSKTELIARMIEMMSRSSLQLRREEPFDWPDIELTMPQLRTLLFLRREPQRMSDVAAFLGSGLSSATSMIERLESKGLVQRIHDPHDRRVVRCHLTEEGSTVLDRMGRVQTSKITAVAELLSHDELKTVVEAMDILSAALERHDNAIECLGVEPPVFREEVDRS